MLNLERQNQWRERYRRQNSNWKPATEVFAGLVRTHLKPSDCILDLGCGRGGLVEQLEHPLQNVIGIDPDWASLHTHRLALPRVAGTGRLPFEAETFDVVYASWVLEHWRHPLHDLSEIERVLKPKGIFVFITPNKRHPLIRFNQAFARVSSFQQNLVANLYGREADDTFPAYYLASSPFDLKMLAEHCGMRLTTLQKIGDPTYLAFSPFLFTIMKTVEEYIPSRRKLHLVGVMKKREFRS